MFQTCKLSRTWYRFKYRFSELALKVVKKNYKLPEVEKKGAFSRLIVHLCNDEEERVKMVAFGGCADRMNALLEENAVSAVHLI